ncbi:MBL fold metallo-hydrolase [Acetanaerobacterium sp. MSJ-12]|uniref:MBL fold metallo-hydrolase n=1 Tax=Acetanaerobacterium sp. MSJ-12 TaxID=2841535 RepID=UPI001C0F3564|nr:MBL fold metallo-hydrolase [Acetanaerobacterium sp. MSJ-12]
MSVKLSVLIENRTLSPQLQCENGFSAFVEAGGHCILFDTGDSGAFLQNAHAMGVDLSQTEAVVLSHAHFDHSRGFLAWREDCPAPEAPLYIHRYFFTPKYWDQEVSYYYVGNAFGQEWINEKKVPCAMVSREIHPLFEDAPIYLLSGFERVCPFEQPDPTALMMLGGEYRTDDFREEMALAIDDGEGLVVLSGCSHCGPVNICESARRRLGKPVRAFVGGTHLVACDEERARQTVEWFAVSGIPFVGVCHCTGEEGLARFAEGCPQSRALASGSVLDL